MTEYTIAYWSRNGKSRAYLNDEQRNAAASIDLLTGDTTGQPEHVELLTQMILDVLPKQDSAPQTVAQQTQIPQRALHTPGKNLTGAPFDDDSIQKGIIGEQRTGGMLSALLNEHGARISHSVILPDRGDGDIDHVLFSQNGIFVINTKYRHNGAQEISRNGALWAASAVDDVCWVSSAVSSAIPQEAMQSGVFVPLICVWSDQPVPQINFTDHRGAPVLVVPGEQIADVISHQPHRLGADDCIAAHRLLENSRKAQVK